MLVLYGLGTLIGDIFLKIFYKDIIDIISVNAPSFEIWKDVKIILLYIGSSILCINIFWRTADFLIAHHQSNVMRVLTNNTLETLQQHSYTFFAGSFSGSLITKVRRFVRSFETMQDKLIFNFWQVGIQLLSVLCILLYTIPILGIFFLCWCVIYIGASYGFVLFSMRYDERAAAADSAVTGQLADIITNVLNLKMFTSWPREKNRFSGYTKKENVALLQAWYLRNYLYLFQGVAMGVLEFLGIFFMIRLWLEGRVTTGDVVLVQSFFTMVIVNTWQIGRSIRDFFKAYSDAMKWWKLYRIR